MNDFVTLLRIRIKAADGQYTANAVKYAWNPDKNSTEHKAVIRQYFNLQNTDMGDDTLEYHAVFILDSHGVCINGEDFDYRVQPEPEQAAE